MSKHPLGKTPLRGNPSPELTHLPTNTEATQLSTLHNEQRHGDKDLCVSDL